MENVGRPIEYRSVTIRKERDGATVESVLKHELEVSGGRISRLKRVDRGLLLNGSPVRTTRRVSEGDEVSVLISDEPLKRTAEPVPFPLDIVYEDRYLLIINKPNGISVHPTINPTEMTLEHAFAAYLGPGIVAHPVSRLDKGTTGLMTVAKYGYVQELLKRKMHSEEFRREYRGIAVGHVTPESGEVYGAIDFAGEASYKRTIVENGPEARTGYEVLSYHGSYTLLRLIPYTGKTHQLRVHMSSIGFPLAGDFMYGAEDRSLIGRPALHSYELWMRHPMTGEDLHFVCPLPEDMRHILETN